MEDKWSIDFKKFKKSSSKKLLKSGLGFFLSPRDESKDNASSSLQWSKKTNKWDNDVFDFDPNSSGSGVAQIQDKDYLEDIPTIPSLDDFADDDTTNQIAKAPLVGVKQVVSYKELETDLLKHSAFASLEGVNLQVLIKLLHPESCLEESDIIWTKDSLFSEVVTVFNERRS